MGGGYIEPDIITLSDYRKQGLALTLCQEFIKQSRQRKLIPYWDCDSGNNASNQLASKLGFNKVGEVPILWDFPWPREIGDSYFRKKLLHAQRSHYVVYLESSERNEYKHERTIRTAH
ncbi:GNAT family N-acetyltransferase [Paenibacillus sp. Marseille-Q9583]